MRGVRKALLNMPVGRFFWLMGVIVVILPAMAVGLVLTQLELAEAEAEHQRQERETLELLALDMKTYLYNFSREEEIPLLEYLELNPRIAGVKVYDFEGDVFLERIFRTRDEPTHTLEEEVLYNGKVIGSVTVCFYNKPFLEHLSDHRRFFLSLLAQLVVALGVFILLARVKIVAPIAYLEGMADRLSKNKLNLPIRLPARDEFGDLAKALEQMRAALKSHIEELDTLVAEQTRELKALNTNLHRRVEEQVRELREKDNMLIQNAKMAEMGEMIAAIAHQLKQPINNISLLAQLAGDEMEEGQTEEVMQELDGILERAAFMAATVDEFRNFFKKDREKSDFSVEESVAAIGRILAYQLKQKQIRLETEGIDPELVCYGYPNQFKQVILNLFTNARDAIARHREQGGVIRVEGRKEGETAVLEIADNGGGIPPELVEKIFQPYFTTKEESGGTGIGLHIIRSILKEHLEGDIRLENGEEGARFILRIPLGGKGEGGA